MLTKSDLQVNSNHQLNSKPDNQSQYTSFFSPNLANNLQTSSNPQNHLLVGSGGTNDGLCSIYGRIQNLRQNLNKNFMNPGDENASLSLYSSSEGLGGDLSYSNTNKGFGFQQSVPLQRFDRNQNLGDRPADLPAWLPPMPQDPASNNQVAHQQMLI